MSYHASKQPLSYEDEIIKLLDKIPLAKKNEDSRTVQFQAIAVILNHQHNWSLLNAILNLFLRNMISSINIVRFDYFFTQGKHTLLIDKATWDEDA